MFTEEIRWFPRYSSKCVIFLVYNLADLVQRQTKPIHRGIPLKVMSLSTEMYGRPITHSQRMKSEFHCWDLERALNSSSVSKTTYMLETGCRESYNCINWICLWKK